MQPNAPNTDSHTADNRSQYQQMKLDEETKTYRGVTVEGQPVQVSEAEWNLCVKEGIESAIENHPDFQDFTGSLEDFYRQHQSTYEQFKNETLILLGDPKSWS